MSEYRPDVNISSRMPAPLGSSIEMRFRGVPQLIKLFAKQAAATERDATLTNAGAMGFESATSGV